MAAFSFSASGLAKDTVKARARLALAARDGVVVRRAPNVQAPKLATLVAQTQVEVIGTHGGWSHVRLWASVLGWVGRHDIAYRRLRDSVSTYKAPEIHYHLHAHGPRKLNAVANVGAAIVYQRVNGREIGHLTPAEMHVSSWAQDSNGTIWYRIKYGWVRGESVKIILPDPVGMKLHGAPLYDIVRGKGMWVTLGTVTDNDAYGLVRAALANGITHLYVESAISPLGFHGRLAVPHLLHLAHAHGIRVVAWVYPYLYDIASDVQLTLDVARFRTPEGDGFDGIAADLERNMSPANVRGYSQLTRAYLGPRYLLVGVTYPPQSLPAFPFGEVSRVYNVVAPMDYWHQTKTDRGLDFGAMRYGYEYGYQYAVKSIDLLRAAGVTVPIAPIGQVFDDFGRFEMGPRAPSGSEISGFLAGCRHGGALGASFFQWMTATDEEWRVIAKGKV